MWFGGGPILAAGGGVDFGGYPKSTAGVSHTPRIGDFRTFSSGAYVAGGPVSATITGSSSNIGLSKSWGAGAAYVTCITVALSCR